MSPPLPLSTKHWGVASYNTFWVDGQSNLNKSLLECVDEHSSQRASSFEGWSCSRGIFLGESSTLMQLLERDGLNSLTCLTTEPWDTIRYFIVMCLFLMCHSDKKQLQYIHQNVYSPQGRQKCTLETFQGPQTILECFCQGTNRFQMWHYQISLVPRAPDW